MDNPKLYVDFNAVQRKDGEKLLAEFSSRFTWGENENVLDIGCGTGDVTTDVLLPHLPKNACLVGVDLSSNMVEFANELYANDRIRFKTVDIATKDIKKHFPEKYFSKIFSCHCLHWVQDTNQLAHNLFTLLRPNGEFLALMTPSSQLFLALKLLSDIPEFNEYCQDIDSIIPPLYYSQNPSEDFKKVLMSHGLDVITCEQRMNPVTYPSIEVMKRSFEAFNPFVKRMPEQVKEKYLNTFEVLARQRIPMSESGEIQLLNPILVVYARRPAQTWSFARQSSHTHTCSGLH